MAIRPRAAHQIRRPRAPLVFVHLGELVTAAWSDIDIEGASGVARLTKSDRPT